MVQIFGHGLPPDDAASFRTHCSGLSRVVRPRGMDEPFWRVQQLWSDELDARSRDTARTQH